MKKVFLVLISLTVSNFCKADSKAADEHVQEAMGISNSAFWSPLSISCDSMYTDKKSGKKIKIGTIEIFLNDHDIVKQSAEPRWKEALNELIEQKQFKAHYVITHYDFDKTDTLDESGRYARYFYVSRSDEDMKKYEIRHHPYRYESEWSENKWNESEWFLRIDLENKTITQVLDRDKDKNPQEIRPLALPSGGYAENCKVPQKNKDKDL